MSRQARLDNPIAVKKIADMKAIGKRIHLARLKLRMPDGRRMTQTDLAALMGVKTRNAVSNWERGKNLPKGASMQMLAKILKMPAQVLFDASAPAPDVPGDSPSQQPPAALELEAEEIETVNVSEVSAKLMADPREYALVIRDVQGRAIAFSVDREAIERLQSCLDVLKKFV